MRFQFLLACMALAALTSGCAAHRNLTAHAIAAPAVTADRVRETLPNDYLRVSFLPAGVKVTSISRPGSLRGFATATVLYAPPLTVAEFPYYSGLANDDSKVLVAMRCRPPHPETVDAVLATWPNIFAAVDRDVPVTQSACDAQPADTATQMACYARGFNDAAVTAVPAALSYTFSYAGVLYDGKHAEMANWLQGNYGIYPAFSGIGYSVKDSYSLNTERMSSQQILVKSASSEYVLKNVGLADAGCHCISVAPYDGRTEDALDPNFIWKAGGDGECKAVARLPKR